MTFIYNQLTADEKTNGKISKRTMTFSFVYANKRICITGLPPHGI